MDYDNLEDLCEQKKVTKTKQKESIDWETFKPEINVVINHIVRSRNVFI